MFYHGWKGFSLRAQPTQSLLAWLGEAQTDEVEANKFFQQKSCENRSTSSVSLR